MKFIYVGGTHKADAMIPIGAPPKRSGSGKVKKRHLYGKDPIMQDISTGSKKVI